MLHSLRVRLLLAQVLVLIVALGTVAWLASRVSASELQIFVERDMFRNRQMLDTILPLYGEDRPQDVQLTAEQLAHRIGERIILEDSTGIVIADSKQALVGQALGCNPSFAAVLVTVGQPHCEPSPALPVEMGWSETVPAVDQGDIIFVSAPISATLSSMALPAASTNTFQVALRQMPEGALKAGMPIMIRRLQRDTGDPLSAGYTSAVNRSLALGAGAAGLAALIATLFVARRILGPVEALTTAAQTLARGDLSGRVPVQTRDEIGTLARTFNTMADALARQEELRRHMVNDVAHELRTPLTNIRGYLEALRDGIAKPNRAMIESLHEEALLLNHLIDDLQELALAEAGQLRLDRRVTALAPLAEQATTAAHPVAEGRGLTLRTELPSKPVQAEIDPERISQILRNLLSNALTHTPDGGTITLRVCAEHQNMECDKEQNGLLIQVSDTGLGIAPEHLPFIFDRFYRADRSRTRATGGTGLGLAIVKQLVELHGGRIWAESIVGSGTVISFTLPAHQA